MEVREHPPAGNGSSHMSAADSPVPLPLSRGFSKLETLPEGFAERMRHQVEIGDVLGERYRILEPIGHGAMGKVFLAENIAIGLRVAVKLLKPELLANPDFRLRFKHEAEAVAAIQHPNVARFLDLIVGDPTFLVMEYVAGPTLHHVIAGEGQLPPRRAVDIAIRLAWGLHAAHRAGVVHRDLKPSNILLQPDEEMGEVPKIIDFGLAKTSASPGAPLTRAGQIVGTPQYMAPEQIARKEVDARADIYALGSVLYAMLCGRPPFTDNGDDVQLLYRQVHEAVEPVRRHAAHVQAELEAVVMRALEKDPSRRFQSAREFARALVPAVEKRALRAPRGPVSEVTDVVRMPRRQPIAWWTALALALLVTGMAVGWWQQRGQHRAMLLVISDPAGAAVAVDGKLLDDRTPTALDAVAPGEHSVSIRHEHYTEVTRLVRIDKGAHEMVDVHLLPKSHSVELQSMPAGASVLVDGALVAGKTPLSFDISDGEYHSIRVEKPGYETYLLKLKPEQSGALPPVVLAPETHPRATLFVDADLPAAVWIDGQYSGFLTPTPGLRVEAGEHRVELRGPAGGVFDQLRARVAQGETARVVLQMKRGGGK